MHYLHVPLITDQVVVGGLGLLDGNCHQTLRGECSEHVHMHPAQGIAPAPPAQPLAPAGPSRSSGPRLCEAAGTVARRRRAPSRPLTRFPNSHRAGAAQVPAARAAPQTEQPSLARSRRGEEAEEGTLPPGGGPDGRRGLAHRSQVLRDVPRSGRSAQSGFSSRVSGLGNQRPE